MPIPPLGDDDDDEEEITVYHGTADNYSNILASGFLPTRLPAYVSTDVEAAEDAIYNKYEVVNDIIDPGKNGGIIASDIPRKEWDALIESGSIKVRENYVGFGRNLNTVEYQLWNQAAIDAFNKRRRGYKKCNK